MPPLPFDPEPIDQLRDRYRSALAKLWPLAPAPTDHDRPGLHRENVFDFSDGTRLIISKHRLEDGEITIHVSASVTYEMVENKEEREHAAAGHTTFPRELPIENFWSISGGKSLIVILPVAAEDHHRLMRWFAPIGN